MSRRGKIEDKDYQHDQMINKQVLLHRRGTTIINSGNPTKAFIPIRGIRQGDQISPYLFILYVEVLSGMLKKIQERGIIRGMSIARKTQAITHLLFVPMIVLIFVKKMRRKSSNYMTCLKTIKSMHANL